MKITIRKTLSGIAGILSIGVFGSCPAIAQSAPSVAAVAPAPATTLLSRQWVFTSKVNGKSYRVQLSLPLGPPPPAGYPVVYVTDGSGFFGAFTDVLRVRTLGGEVEPAVVVGISYPEEDFGVQMSRRTLDLTQIDADAETKAASTKSPVPLDYAGADNFLRIIQTEIKPHVATLTKVDPARSILYGHSLGGLFTLHVLFTHPEAFQTYLASSPSIWWHDRDVLKDEAAFSKRVTEGKIAPRIFILVGGEEQTPPSPPYPPGMTREVVEKMMRRSAMVDNARALAERLAALKGAAGYRVESKIYDGESHLSVPFASFNTLTRFALPPVPPPSPK